MEVPDVVPVLILVNGLPASGKTTLARRLARDLSLPAFCKDDLKEILFDTLGWSDRRWSQKLGGATFGLLLHIAATELAAGRSIVLEAYYHPEISTDELSRLKERCPFRPVQIYCRADAEILVKRYRARTESGERHPGHVDRECWNEVESVLRAPHAPMELGGTLIEVDTGTPYEELLERVAVAFPR